METPNTVVPMEYRTVSQAMTSEVMRDAVSGELYKRDGRSRRNKGREGNAFGQMAGMCK